MIGRVRFLFTWLFSIVALTLFSFSEPCLAKVLNYINLMNEKKSFYKCLGVVENLLEEFSFGVTQPHSFNVELTLIFPLKENCLIKRMLSGKVRFMPKSAMLIISNIY